MKSKPNLLIYAHYYYPDVASTGQILTEQAEGMKDDFNITVICTVPSYTGTIEEKYKEKKYYEEDINGIRVIRVRVPEFSKENKMSRVKNIMTYFFRAWHATHKTGKIDYVLSISQPPILGGLLGVLGKWMKHAKYIYNIKDFNPEQIMAVNYSKNKLILRFMMALDKFSCKRSDLVITIGRDMVETLQKRFKGKKVPKVERIYDWIDEKAIYPLEHTEEHVAAFREKYGLNRKLHICYSGNVGIYYDLENLIKVVERFNHCEDIVFSFIGEGVMKKQIESYAKEKQLDNVVFIPYQKKEDIIYSLNSADALWVVNAKGIKGVSMPSKLYGVMAVGKATLGVLEQGSEGCLLIDESKCGLCVEPGDYDGVYNLIQHMRENPEELREMGMNGRRFMEKNLTKEVSIQKYIDVIKAI